MSVTYIENIVLKTLRCGECGMTFGVPQFWIEERRRVGGEFHCPNGHTRIFRETQNERLQRELTVAKCDALAKQHELDNATRLLDSANRKIERVKKGVCPCCKRSFSNLRRHMKSKHPDKRP